MRPVNVTANVHVDDLAAVKIEEYRSTVWLAIGGDVAVFVASRGNTLAEQVDGLEAFARRILAEVDRWVLAEVDRLAEAGS